MGLTADSAELLTRTFGGAETAARHPRPPPRRARSARLPLGEKKKNHKPTFPSPRCRQERRVAARAAYGREVPSAENPPSRMVASMSMGGGGGPPGQAPPDLPSLLLNARICYLGMPIVPAVTELIVAELLFLNFDNPEKPVYFYINSSGSQSADGQSVGFETEAYAILDTLQAPGPRARRRAALQPSGNVFFFVSA